MPRESLEENISAGKGDNKTLGRRTKLSGAMSTFAVEVMGLSNYSKNTGNFANVVSHSFRVTQFDSREFKSSQVSSMNDSSKLISFSAEVSEVQFSE